MRHVPVTCEQREQMLRAIGASSVDELFDDIPPKARLGRPLELPREMTEMELAAHLRGLADADTPATRLACFAGAGSYDHYVPSIVDHVLRRPEFFTAYTPYQPEVSQGTLQAIWEYQSMICELTGLDVANASMYDGATAFVEAALMAARVTKRQKVVVSGAVNPHWLETLRTYAAAGVLEPVFARVDDGRCALDGDGGVASLVEGAAAVLVASPGVAGAIEDLSALAALAHDAGALLVVAANPVLLGVMTPPAELGADIVVGEGQPLGSAMSFGGPGFGFFACREQHIRQMPGRLVGRTLDADDNPGFVLTFSTREQHIRREKATSNICSNQALCALGAAVHLSALGREGLAGVARASVAKAHHLRDRLLATGRFSAPWDAPFGYEFALLYEGDSVDMQARLLEKGFLAGVRAADLGSAPDGIDAATWERLVIFAATEKRTAAEIDGLAEAVSVL